MFPKAIQNDAKWEDVRRAVENRLANAMRLLPLFHSAACFQTGLQGMGLAVWSSRPSPF